MFLITVIKSLAPARVCKTYVSGSDGVLTKKSVAHITRGEARTVEITTADDLIAVLGETTTSVDKALVLSAFKGATPGKPPVVEVVTKDALERIIGGEIDGSRGFYEKDGRYVSARLKELMDPSGVILIDADNPPEMPEEWKRLTIAERLQRFEAILPGISTCARIEYRGSSARVVKAPNGSGEENTGPTHALIWISDPSKLDMLRERLRVQSVVAGLSFEVARHAKDEPGKVVGVERRTLIDLAVLVDARLVFNAKPDAAKAPGYHVLDADVHLVNPDGGPLNVDWLKPPDEAMVNDYRKITGLNVQLDGEGGLCAHEHGTLKLSTKIESRGETKPLDAWLTGMLDKDIDKLRCEAPFRSSNREAAAIRIVEHPKKRAEKIFVYDSGTTTNYYLDPLPQTQEEAGRKAGSFEEYEAFLAVLGAQARQCCRRASLVFTPLTDEEFERNGGDAVLALAARIAGSEAEREFAAGGEAVPKWLKEMNARYAFIRDRPNAAFDTQGTETTVIEAVSMSGFHNIFANKLVPAGPKSKLTSQSKLWFTHKLRREYETAGDYPVGKAPDGALNLWTGLAVEPKAGKWPLIEEFLLHVVCAGSRPDYAWLLKLLFWKIQNPTVNPEVAISLQGKQGVGKGTFGVLLKTIFGPKRYRLFGRPEDMSSRFNAGAEGKLVLFYDEAVFAHDPKIRGRLKNEITESTFTIERKGIDQYTVRNMALRIFVSNDVAPVAIDLDDRRVLVLEAADLHAKDEAYFAALLDAFAGGEIEAFVHDALAADLGTFEATRRNPPRTKAKAALAVATAKPEHEFLIALLDKGDPPVPTIGWQPKRYPRMSVEPPDPWRDGPVTVERDAPHQAYLDWLKNTKPHARPANAAQLYGMIQQVLGVALFHSQQVRDGASTRRMTMIGSLDECRKAFNRHTGYVHEWS
jgi:hypothetical protein